MSVELDWGLQVVLAVLQLVNSGKVDWGLATKHGLYGAGLGGASRWLANRGWY